MKYIFLIVVVLVTGAVASFAIYTFGWRDEAPDEGGRALAVLTAEQLRAGDPDLANDCEVANLEHIAETVWRVRFACPRSGGITGPQNYSPQVCFAIDVGAFRVASSGQFSGAASVACP